MRSGYPPEHSPTLSLHILITARYSYATSRIKVGGASLDQQKTVFALVYDGLDIMHLTSHRFY